MCYAEHFKKFGFFKHIFMALEEKDHLVRIIIIFHKCVTPTYVLSFFWPFVTLYNILRRLSLTRKKILFPNCPNVLLIFIFILFNYKVFHSLAHKLKYWIFDEKTWFEVLFSWVKQVKKICKSNFQIKISVENIIIFTGVNRVKKICKSNFQIKISVLEHNFFTRIM